jgi:delta-1-pyrroline-5-carboxylate synthetase
MQLDVTSSQLLVTDNVFKNEGFRKQLSDTVNSLLNLRVIPVFNENDAVSTRKAPYQVCSSSFAFASTFAFEISPVLLGNI